MITTMAVLVVLAPFVYLFLLRSNPQSFWVRNFIWIVIVAMLGVLFSGLSQQRRR
ncbi:MAG: hypothetical protein HPY68_02775 [Candidatus Atribacteria bacterium]|nr:hypothetical protein [Candidatus Atribacteria bacterium]